ncbi:peptidyl-tRNA hydrolase [Tenacibaculum skagerrakense]|uniref:Peptidyl-tRNA hydrolase n=1 Tax=Tenacibaculum skagerrakense TaxID=186571 RepID=A0A4R2P008_9FLAO|nr:aminoacyl-tRNA hydrolase [Tenacibaculum skagerrakense]TCP27920.1 peptidyl-tRNA hydrolase [Tenacibaculum skagerrakense]
MSILSFFNNLLGVKKETQEEIMKKFLVVGLGNIGEKYDNTRHNIGFKIADALVKEYDESFTTEKHGDLVKLKIKGKTVFVLKPNTYMNLSGKAVLYWMKKENILIDNILIITDDLNIDFGTIRIKAKGSAGGHNGLKDIQDKLNTSVYPRFRFGVGSDYRKGGQVDFVLGTWSNEEESALIERIPTSIKAVESFVNAGLANTMNTFNGK